MDAVVAGVRLGLQQATDPSCAFAKCHKAAHPKDPQLRSHAFSPRSLQSSPYGFVWGGGACLTYFSRRRQHQNPKQHEKSAAYERPQECRKAPRQRLLVDQVAEGAGRGRGRVCGAKQLACARQSPTKPLMAARASETSDWHGEPLRSSHVHLASEVRPGHLLRRPLHLESCGCTAAVAQQEIVHLTHSLLDSTASPPPNHARARAS